MYLLLAAPSNRISSKGGWLASEFIISPSCRLQYRKQSQLFPVMMLK
jgi:hypothetical protein